MRVHSTAGYVALLTLGCRLLVTTPGRAQGPALTPDQSLARDILTELIAISTTHDHGNTTPAALAIARAVSVESLDSAIPSPPSPLVPEVFLPLERLTREMWGDVPVIPNMETGATDGLYLRNAGMPVYGVSGVFLDADDIRAHGRDERILVRGYYAGAEFTYRFVKALTASGRR